MLKMRLFSRLVVPVLVLVAIALPGGAQELTSTSNEQAIELPLFQFALEREDVRSWELFIERYPNSTLRPQAEAELARVRAKNASRSLEDELFSIVPPVTFSAPLAITSPEIDGLSIEQILAVSPAFPPVEGLPAEVWQNQTCANCHVWTRENICEHAGRYIHADPSGYQDKKHPFGGTFKTNLRQWALNDCQ